MRRFPLRDLTRCGLLAALMAVCAWTAVPLGDTVFTLQTLGVLLALGLLGGKWGTVSIGCYLLLGAVGAPVFSSFRGGAAALLSPTGGYLWGFLSTGLCYWAVERFGKLPAMILGQLMCYACGTAWYLAWTGGGAEWILLRCVVPYLIPDTAKLLLAWHLTKRLKKRI